MSLINLIIAARNAWSVWRRRQRAYTELSALDDRSLADIGIRRSEIPAVLEGLHNSADRQTESDRPREPAGAGRRTPTSVSVQLTTGRPWFPPF